MTKIKICGLSRPCDVEYVNAARPDYCGFIIDVPKSRRNVAPEQVRALRAGLAEGIAPVGVFVNAPLETVVPLAQEGTVELVQLHGRESEEYIRALRDAVHVPVIQAFQVSSLEDVSRALQSTADYILLDHGAGGTGACFDWSLLEGVSRPFFLAGGLGPDNLTRAVETVHPFAVDMSSGVETDGVKDREKILAAVAAVRGSERDVQGALWNPRRAVHAGDADERGNRAGGGL